MASFREPFFFAMQTFLNPYLIALFWGGGVSHCTLQLGVKHIWVAVWD